MRAPNVRSELAMAEAMSIPAGETAATPDPDPDDTSRVLRSRKRVSCVNQWKRSQRKRLRNSGQGYTTKKKKEVWFTCT